MKQAVFTILIFSFFISYLYAVELDSRGNVYDIAERDFLDEIKDRASNVDWQKKAQEAAERFKKKVGRVDFDYPKAAKDSSYFIDLTQKLDHDIYIRDKQGNPKLIYPKGYVYNALDYVTLHYRYVIFDAERKEEVAWFKARYAKDPNSIPIISRGNAYELSQDVKRQVYLLDTVVADRFKVKATPLYVYQKGNKLQVDEIMVSEDEQ